MPGRWSDDGPKAPWDKSRELLSERKGSGSQSPHSSGEAGNDRGGKVSVSGVVGEDSFVGKVGTATLTRAELAASFLER